ncbi:MAG: carbon-monoxide dehydrogenase medium subunit [Gammaproteobacteria bacterium]|jgi:carbon-monoxide dehydrogenase medium subunit
MYNFKYQRPGSLDDAAKALAGAEDGTLVAGGMTLLPTMKQRLAQPSDLVDLNAIDDLAGISKEGDSIVIGAMTRHAVVARSTLVQEAIPALAELAEAIGDPQVRNRGTIGGSVANADPAADYPAGLVGLNATVHTNKRTIAADDFFTALFETALDEHEIVTGVSFPIPGKAAYMKFPNPASRYAIVGVFVAQAADGVRVAVTGAAGSVFRVAAMEAALADNFTSEALSGIAIADDDLNSDIHASADYRAHLVGVMAQRAVDKANA